MIGRIWHGWTKAENADAYEALLRGEVLPGIEAMNVAGYRGVEVFRRTLDSGEVEFVTIKRFDSIDAVKRSSGTTTRWPLSHRGRARCCRAGTSARSITRSGSAWRTAERIVHLAVQ